MRRVGVIGGNGVAATNKLCELVEVRLTREGAFRDAHQPEMIIWQATQAPSRSMYLEGRGESFVEDYVAIGKQLKAAGATAICMCCNTAHYAVDELQDRIGLPFLNLVRDVVQEAAADGTRSVGLVASDGCLRGKVYERYFESICPDVRIVYPDPAFQAEVTRGICNVKNPSRFLDDGHPDRPQTIFSRVHDHLVSQGAERVIMGCTDIRVDYSAVGAIDSLETLARTIISYYGDGK